MGTIILPQDPDFHQPLKMGDPYEQALTPKLAAEKKKEAFSKNGSNYAPSQIANFGDTSKVAQVSSGNTNMITSPMFFSPIHTNQSWQTPAKRREMYMWARFFYQNEPKVAAAIDFYSKFSMNNFKIDCSNSNKIEEWFKHNVVKKLNLNEILKAISTEYFVLGDVFIHTNIDCPKCKGNNQNEDNPAEECGHEGGTISKIIILKPDDLEVKNAPFADEPVITMIPDQEWRTIVEKKQPKKLYDMIPDALKLKILNRVPIELSNRTTTHLKHMPCPYENYGTSLIRRLFVTLAYKTKLMSANWIVAERMILPVRVVKVGSDERPATPIDIIDIQQQLAATANDPNLTIITHNNFDYEFYGANSKILQTTQEMEFIGKEILDGFMLNQALLNGEMSGWSSAQVGVETLIRRIESFRETLAQFVEDRIFKPIAEMQGFIDEKKSKELGVPVYIYPKLIFNDLNLRDKTQERNLYVQLHDKGVISTRTLCEKTDIDYDKEIHRKRFEQVAGGPAGGGLGMGAPGGGGAPMGGGGGAPGGGMGGGPPGGMAGGPPGMGGADPGMAGGGAPGGGMGGGGPTAGAGGMKILKKGKHAHKDEEMQQQQVAPIQLTSLEQEMAGLMEEVGIKLGWNAQQIFNNIRIQYPVQNPDGHKPYMLDFAIPKYKIASEVDGGFWHSQPEQIAEDKERDFKLAKYGWTVLRFDDNTVNENREGVISTVMSYIQKAMKMNEKKASVEDDNTEYQPVGAHLFVMKNGEMLDIQGQYELFNSLFDERRLH